MAPSLAIIEAYQAQCADSLRRLESCRNTRCTVTFFDRSRNNGDVWHGVRLCGNAATRRICVITAPGSGRRPTPHA
ncbi:CGNR zinc finger domain-containing protein [Streptomyces mirabilis]|uniref:CGNR zinc finger domain-containing protein n=1 Tax=Streptomyces mirabilis TaxID=68239 RepID=UPI0036D0B317